MAKQVRHRNPKFRGHGFGGAGCLWGLFNSFDVHHRFRLPKMLGDRRSTTPNSRHATGCMEPRTKTDASLASDDERDLSESDANIPSPVEGRDVERPPTEKTSGKSSRKPYSIALEISRQQDVSKHKGRRQTRKVTPFAARLLRTMSINHMESDDYYYGDPNDVPEAGRLQDPPLLPHGSGTPSTGAVHAPANSPETHGGVVINKGRRCDACGTATHDPAGHVCRNKLDELGFQLLEKQALLREKLREAKESLMRRREDDEDLQEDVARRHSCDIREALELFNANNELFLKLMHREPDSDMTGDSRGREEYYPEGGGALIMTRCGSFPGAGSKSGSFKFKDEAGSEAEKLQSSPGCDQQSRFMVITPRPAAPPARGILETAAGSVPSSSFAQVAVKRHNKDNGSAAAFHFKVIKQRIKDIIKDNKKERRRIAMDGVLHRVPVDKFCSCSSERFDGESSRFSFGSDAGGSSTAACRVVPFSSIPRSQSSLSESVDKYAHLLESTTRREPNKPQVSERLKLADEDGGSQATVQPPRTFGRIFSLPEFEACFHKDDQNEASLHLSHSKPGSVLDPADNHDDDDDEEEESKHVMGVGEQNLSRSVDHRGSEASVLDDETDAASGAETDEQVSAAPCVEAGDGAPEEPSSNAALVDLDLAVYPVNIPAEYSSVFQAAAGWDSELEIDHEVQSEGRPDPSDDHQHNQSDAANGVSTIMETDELLSDYVPLDFDVPIPVPADRQQHDQIEFNYVKDVLKAYLFDYSSNIEHSETWSSPSAREPAEPSKLDRELLYDLTNQILVQICENSCGQAPWLSVMWGNSHTRPAPVGFRLLEEVWASISWHLKAHTHANPSVEYILERDFRKKDGWMNLNPDLEYVGVDLEAALLDDLIDETLFEVLDWDFS